LRTRTVIASSVFVALGFVIALMYGDSSYAQAPTATSGIKDLPFRVAVLNMERIRREAAAVKDIRAQIEKYRNEFRQDVQKEEKALRAANQELAKKRTILSPEAFSKERRSFEQKVVEVQKLVQRYKVDLNQALGKAMLEVDRKLNGIVAKTAGNKNISIVFRRRQTILVARYLDMTDEVLQQLNAQLKKVAVAKPGTK